MGGCPSCGTAVADDARFCAACGTALSGDGNVESRRTVTVLFCDVVGSTALGESLDPEALRAVLARYFERMKAIVEQYGGTVEKFIGDAVMAVFGLPVVHEDDAVRAVIAADQMRAALPELNIEGRIGVATGEVVTGTSERLVTGDVVNLAARLEQTAGPGEVLLDDATYFLVRRSVDAVELDPVSLKGKARPVPVRRLVSVSSAPSARTFDSTMVGRQDELNLLRQTWSRVRGGPGCELVTVAGPAGVGKSRLVAELLADVADDATTVVRARCLPYGEGISYWPVVGALKQLEELGASAELDDASQRALGVLLSGEGASSADEIARGVRKLLAAVAAHRPLVVVFDDIHWGEDVFLDLVEHVGLLAGPVPLLLLCIARPELLEHRPEWPGVVRLEPLGRDECARLLSERLAARDLDASVRERILAAAGGNPLFVEEMAAVIDASGGGEVVVPSTIRALLAARLDQLEHGDRLVLEHGAVEGELFHQGAVAALTPEEPRLTARLTGLVRHELLRADRASLPGEDAFRFRHLLIRDAAYDGLAKSVRADLHERFAGWLIERGPDLVELDEIAGYHLEQAHRYRDELGVSDAGPGAVGARAAGHLGSAGKRALARGDLKAAVNLLSRAKALQPEGMFRTEQMLDLTDALFFAGRLDEGAELAAQAEQAAAARGDARGELLARIQRMTFEVFQGRAAAADLLATAQRAVTFFDESGDDRGLMRAWGEVGSATANFGSNETDAQAALERAIDCAERLGDEAFYLQTLEQQLCAVYTMGPTPVPSALSWLEGRPNLTVHRQRASLLSMLGRFDEARAILDDALQRHEELGDTFSVGACCASRSEVERLAGDLDAAIEWSQRSFDTFVTMEHNAWLPSAAGRLSILLSEANRREEAEELAVLSERESAERDVDAQQIWRLARAHLLAREGAYDEAVRLAEEAVAVRAGTDLLNIQARAYVELANVLTTAGRDPADALRQALARYERKGNVVMAERVRKRLGIAATVT